MFIGATGRLAAAHSLAARFPTDVRWRGARRADRNGALLRLTRKATRSLVVGPDYLRSADRIVLRSGPWICRQRCGVARGVDHRRSTARRVEQCASSTLSAGHVRAAEHACTAPLSSISQDATLDELLLTAGETVWVAGPLRKGSGLWHAVEFALDGSPGRCALSRGALRAMTACRHSTIDGNAESLA